MVYKHRKNCICMIKSWAGFTAANLPCKWSLRMDVVCLYNKIYSVATSWRVILKLGVFLLLKEILETKLKQICWNKGDIGIWWPWKQKRKNVYKNDTFNWQLIFFLFWISICIQASIHSPHSIPFGTVHVANLVD